ncbi:MAG: hypothetical protein IJQ89_12010 [Bacteroidales bacterium]|nr:hypothetical protein [Bacteroidales bacterium]
MKKVIFFSAMCLTLAVCVAWISPNGNTNAASDGDKADAYVDMGLPSGTKWKATNEFGFFDYEAATTRFEGKLPTAKQFMELWRFCKWVWTSDGYRVTGPNGNSIFLPLTGKRDCNGSVKNANLEGYYWSITPNGDGVERLFLAEGHVGVSKETKCSAVCVRLVKHGK